MAGVDRDIFATFRRARRVWAVAAILLILFFLTHAW